MLNIEYLFCHIITSYIIYIKYIILFVFGFSNHIIQNNAEKCFITCLQRTKNKICKNKLLNKNPRKFRYSFAKIFTEIIV